MIREREPLAADRFLAQKLPNEPTQRERHRLLREQLREAKRFVFDAAATEHVGRIIRDIPEAVALGQEFAQLPYKLMYIEIPGKLLWTTINYPEQPVDNSDTRLGYLFLGNHVRVLAEAPDADSPRLFCGFLPLTYALWEPQQTIPPVPDAKAITGRGRFANSIVPITDPRQLLDGFFWGSNYAGLPERLRSSLSEYHSVQVEARQGITEADFWRVAYEGAAGDLRNIIALLLALVQPRYTMYEEIKATPGLVHRKSVGLLSHTRVTIHVDPIPHLRRIISEATVGHLMAHHSVLSHYCHDKTARWQHVFASETERHMPDWEELTGRRWKCRKCGGMRWWRVYPNGHGRKEVGLVQSEYAVKR